MRGGGEGRKQFFFEKKNQKTFVYEGFAFFRRLRRPLMGCQSATHPTAQLMTGGLGGAARPTQSFL
jgi:hypothetical protein